MCMLACCAYTVFKMCVQTIVMASFEVIVSFLKLVSHWPGFKFTPSVHQVLATLQL